VEELIADIPLGEGGEAAALFTGGSASPKTMAKQVAEGANISVGEAALLGNALRTTRSTLRLAQLFANTCELAHEFIGFRLTSAI
jgi:hypothetical protein